MRRVLLQSIEVARSLQINIAPLLLVEANDVLVSGVNGMFEEIALKGALVEVSLGTGLEPIFGFIRPLLLPIDIAVSYFHNLHADVLLHILVAVRVESVIVDFEE